jgi:hypothetical protein
MQAESKFNSLPLPPESQRLKRFCLAIAAAEKSVFKLPNLWPIAVAGTREEPIAASIKLLSCQKYRYQTILRVDYYVAALTSVSRS